MPVETQESEPTTLFSEQQFILQQRLQEPLSRDAEVIKRGRRKLTCMDEGTPDGEVRIAGAGITDPKGFDHAVEMMREAGVDMVTSHDDCGACMEAAKQKFGDGATKEQADELGKQWAKDMAAALDVPYEHIENLDRGEEHEAVCVYINMEEGEGLRFDLDKTHFPKGFTVTDLPNDPSLTAEQAAFAARLALERGAYKDQFSEDAKFSVVLVGGKEGEHRHAVIEALRHALKDLGPRVQIESMRIE